ncbi:MAG TPA: hypothetical protein PLU22_21215 [Polyangiaceae bacterium]|nr:hypothetical protein [Polyangiaceae bacterium]
MRQNAPGAGCPDPEAAFQRARQASGEGRWEDAIAAFDLAIRARPVQARLRAERGYAYLESGDAKRARQDFYDALTLTHVRHARDPRAPGAGAHDLDLHRPAPRGLRAVRLCSGGHRTAPVGYGGDPRRRLHSERAARTPGTTGAASPGSRGTVSGHG